MKWLIDVALVDGGYKIIEINCINCAGLYKGDVVKLVGLLNQLLEG